ncbi:MAG: hypothetical protein F6K11_09860 [Leptolyngbya sp. SIO3F4]|nr:hypothetical protein [Leptolyngbya sp. SIO3F4]
MIAIDYIQLIDQGVDTWNQWRLEHPDECPDLESAYLFEKSLSGINLSYTNLSRACLIGANLEKADLTGANLSGVYANNANFQKANFAGADLQEGNFIEANLIRANLSNALTDKADFTNAYLQGTCLVGWPVIDSHQFSTKLKSKDLIHKLNVLFPIGSNSISWLQLLGATGGAVALTTAVFLLTRPKAPNFVAADGSVTLELFCDESDVTSIEDGKPDHIYQNETRFYGRFANGKPADGRGSMLYANGNRYDGEYRNGQRNGCGIFTFGNGRRYVGEFSNDLFSGRGAWILENGDRYIGDFEFNKCNGEGVFIFADGTSQSGIWQQGRLVNGDLTCNNESAD